MINSLRLYPAPVMDRRYCAKVHPVLCEGLLMLAHAPVYHPRVPTDSHLWKILHNHYEDFKAGYGEDCEKHYGFFRSVVDEVVEEYLRCGDLHEACPELVEGDLPGCAVPTLSAVIEAQSRLKRDTKEHQQALVGTVVKREAGNYLQLRHSLLIRLPSFVLYLRTNR